MQAYEFAVTHKNQYPYRTLHTINCGRFTRAKWTEVLDENRASRLDLVRMDYCKDCVGKRIDDQPSPALRHLWTIQRRQQELDAAVAAKRRLAIRIAVLRAALDADLEKADEDVMAEANRLTVELLHGVWRGPEVVVR